MNFRLPAERWRRFLALMGGSAVPFFLPLARSVFFFFFSGKLSSETGRSHFLLSNCMFLCCPVPLARMFYESAALVGLRWRCHWAPKSAAPGGATWRRVGVRWCETLLPSWLVLKRALCAVCFPCLSFASLTCPSVSFSSFARAAMTPRRYSL